MKSQRLNPTSWLLSLALLATIGLAGCSFAATNTNQPAANTNQQPSDNANEAAMKKEVTVTLTEQNSSGQSGTATITDQNGKAKVTIAISSASATPQPAHIHVGACPAPGAVKYPLSNVVNGRSETMLSVSVDELLDQLPLAINVHKSTTQSTIYFSCGDIK